MSWNPFVPHGPEPYTPTPPSGGLVPSVVEFFKSKIDELFRRSVFTVNHVAPVDGNVDVAVSASDVNAVHYDKADGKTNEQQATARANISAPSVSEMNTAIANAKAFPIEIVQNNVHYIISIYDNEDDGIGLEVTRKAPAV